jgi:predicted acyl esterase
MGLTLLAWMLATALGRGQQISEASPAQLRQWLREYPDADANGDGQLTVQEAEAYRQQVQRRQAERRVADQHASPKAEFTFAEMSDGTKIALAIAYPNGFSPDADRRWPTIFSTCGYTSATAPMDPGMFGHRCITVNASLRGTGASGGVFSPWTPRTWQDGHEIIENWIVKQPWSNGRVALVGHSWPGLMGFLVATTNPPSLKAVCVSGLIEDFYRGIGRIGGVRNCGFPVNWLNAYYDPNGPFGSHAAAREMRKIDDATFQDIVASRPDRDLAEDMLWLLLNEPFDNPQLQEQSLHTYVSRIRAPILIMQSYQDEQTGPTGWRLWKQIPEDVPKRLLLSNGAHNVTPGVTSQMAAWFEHWLLQTGDGAVAAPEHRVQVYFETQGDGRDRRISLNPPLQAADFPLPNTHWSRFYLHSDRSLSAEPPVEGELDRQYRVVAGDPSSNNERLEYVLEFGEPTAICGPIVLTLWAQLTTLDTDFFALLGDLAPDGTLYGLQRGVLRASHRQMDEAKSGYVDQDGERLLIRPHHSHDCATPVTPHQPYRFDIQIFTVGHVFRPGHKLVLRLSRPPLGDPIGVTRSGEPSYQYDSDRPPGVVKVLHNAEHPSSLLLPILPALPPVSPDPVPLDKQAGIQAAP